MSSVLLDQVVTVVFQHYVEDAVNDLCGIHQKRDEMIDYTLLSRGLSRAYICKGLKKVSQGSDIKGYSRYYLESAIANSLLRLCTKSLRNQSSTSSIDHNWIRLKSHDLLQTMVYRALSHQFDKVEDVESLNKLRELYCQNSDPPTVNRSDFVLRSVLSGHISHTLNNIYNNPGKASQEFISKYSHLLSSLNNFPVQYYLSLKLETITSKFSRSSSTFHSLSTSFPSEFQIDSYLQNLYKTCISENKSNNVL